MINHTSNTRFLTLISVGLLSITALTACIDDSIKQTDNTKQNPQEAVLKADFTQTPSEVVFTNKKQVTYGELLPEIEKIAINLESSAILQAEFKQLQASHGIANNGEMYKDFVRVRLVFEATRDSGLWQLRWAVTDQEPNSDRIWKQWREGQNQTKPQTTKATATAECDELSALFSVIARGLGVAEVGLFWPTYNHTVAVWKAKDDEGNEVRVVVPTSQIFLNKSATLGTTDFDPYKQKNIYNYTRKDVKTTDKIPAPLAEMMLAQLKTYGGESGKQLQNRRNQLSVILGGS